MRGRDSPRLFPRFPTSHEAASYSLSPSRTTLRRIPHDDKSLDTTATCLTNENHAGLRDVTGLSELSPNRGHHDSIIRELDSQFNTECGNYSKWNVLKVFILTINYLKNEIQNILLIYRYAMYAFVKLSYFVNLSYF